MRPAMPARRSDKCKPRGASARRKLPALNKTPVIHIGAKGKRARNGYSAQYSSRQPNAGRLAAGFGLVAKTEYPMLKAKPLACRAALAIKNPEENLQGLTSGLKARI